MKFWPVQWLHFQNCAAKFALFASKQPILISTAMSSWTFMVWHLSFQSPEKSFVVALQIYLQNMPHPFSSIHIPYMIEVVLS